MDTRGCAGFLSGKMILLIMAIGVGAVAAFFAAFIMPLLAGPAQPPATVSAALVSDEDVDTSDELLASVVSFTNGQPDGSGHVLYWAKTENGRYALVRFPVAKAVCVARGFDDVSWLADEGAIGAVVAGEPGVMVLRSVPFVNRISGIGPGRKASFFKIDVNAGTIGPLARSSWPDTRDSKDAFAVILPDNPNASTRGQMRVTLEEAPASKSAPARRLIKLEDKAAGDTKVIFETGASQPALGQPAFLDDDTVLFPVGGTMRQYVISTGEITDVFTGAQAVEE